MSTNLESIQMLSIDDRTITTDLDRAGYRKMGVIVRPASNYEEAERILRREKVDVIVINMDYSAIDAVAITRHVKKSAQWNELPIVITSVQTSAKVRSSAVDAGADMFVEQPLPRQYFIEKLKKLLDERVRGTERVSVHGEVTFTYDNNTYTSAIGDLSSTGILISTNITMKDETDVEMSFALPGYKKPIKVFGKVVRTIRSNDINNPGQIEGVGIRFENFEGDSQKRLERYVEKSADVNGKMIYYL
jgi:response regulator RpfG family c-di-GMP phosphodiesterase